LGEVQRRLEAAEVVQQAAVERVVLVLVGLAAVRVASEVQVVVVLDLEDSVEVAPAQAGLDLVDLEEAQVGQVRRLD
jgi:hypothetical protein